MKIFMVNSRLVNFIQIKEFLQGTTAVDLSLANRKEKYTFVKKTFDEFQYTTLSKKQKGLLRRYIRKSNRLFKSTNCTSSCCIIFGRSLQNRSTNDIGLTKKYTASDKLLLAKTDNLHGRLNGIATKLILQKEYKEFHKEEYKRISDISVSHIYNFRKTKKYFYQALTYTKTNPVKRAIGERRKPQPDGKPGFIRVDSVHQGDSKKKKRESTTLTPLTR